MAKLTEEAKQAIGNLRPSLVATASKTGKPNISIKGLLHVLDDEHVILADTALEKLRTERYSLVLLDIKLPGMSGIELYHHIEEIAPALARRVMFVTGDVMESATRSFLEKTGVPYITKPLDIEVLKKTINRALNQTQVTVKASG